MKTTLLAVLILGLLVMSGCNQGPKREQSAEGTIEEPVTVVTSGPAANIPSAPVSVSATEPAGPGIKQSPAVEGEVEADPKARLTDKSLQLALKNAGFYNGVVDGKIGPKTKKAIEDFQAKNNLEVDGKVGPQTWSKLKGYLNSSESQPLSGVTSDIKD